jgi:hypothetical protein
LEHDGNQAVVGTTYDPATPYQGAQAMTRELGDARLLTLEGYGHTTLTNPSRCVNEYESRYLSAHLRGACSSRDRGDRRGGCGHRFARDAFARDAFARGDFSGPVDIGGGRRLYLECKGRGSPTVILESGIHDSSDPWGMTDTEPPAPSTPAVFAGVARFTRVCKYDRPGTIRYTNPNALTTRSSRVYERRTLAGMVRYAENNALDRRATKSFPTSSAR